MRIGWIVAPPELVAECWSQHDYLTIGPNKLSDRLAQVAVEGTNRERCYARTRAILRHNLPIARDWIAGFGGSVSWREPQAGAIALLRYHDATSSLVIAERVRTRQSTSSSPAFTWGSRALSGYGLAGANRFCVKAFGGLATS